MNILVFVPLEIGITMIQLQIITFKDNKRKEAFIVKNFPATFGRDPSCTYTFFEDGASRVHFSIECIENAFFLKDLKSTNGTKLNGEEVIHEVQLHNKDIIVAGKSVFEVVLKELFLIVMLPRRYRNFLILQTSLLNLKKEIQELSSLMIQKKNLYTVIKP